MAEPEKKSLPTLEAQPAKDAEGNKTDVPPAEGAKDAEGKAADLAQAKTEAQKRLSQSRLHVGILVSYYLLLLCICLWGILDVWSSNLTVARWAGVKEPMISHPMLRTIAFTMIGGLLGSILFQIKTLFRFYVDDCYDPRWFGKYLSGPWEAASMAVVVLAIIRGGVAAFGGSTGTDIQPVNNFAAFGTGALVGFGMRDVLGWLGALVKTMFPKGPKKEKTKRRSAPENSSNGNHLKPHNNVIPTDKPGKGP